MKLDDLETAVYEGLRGLSYRSYLHLMYGICDEFRRLYGDQLPSESQHLISESLSALAAAIAGRDSAATQKPDARTAALWQSWDGHMTSLRGSISAGLDAALQTVAGIVGELAYARPPYWGAERIDSAIRFCQEPETPPSPQSPEYLAHFQLYEWLNSPLEADEEALHVRLLRAIETAIGRSSADSGILQCEPGVVREMIFAGIPGGLFLNAAIRVPR